MGRKKKKPFIDKKNAQTYRLVPRSQQDPLAENIDEAQHVLKAVELPSEERRLEEQHKFGVYYDDEYDYLQHLKEPGTAVLEPVRLSSGPTNQITAVEREDKIGLPGDLFGSEVTIDGHLERILPVTGPQPGWDPDIVAALEEAELAGSGCEGDLDDNFVLLANSGEPGLPVYVSEQTGGVDTSDTSWWKSRVDFTVEQDPNAASSDQSDSAEEGDQSDVSSNAAGMSEGDVMERKSARFTQYSLSSSVVPRSETLTMLDDRFEEFMAEYEDSELGALDEDCEASGGGEYEHLILHSVIQNFEKHFKHQIHNVEVLQESVGGVPRPPTKKEGVANSDKTSEGVDSDGVSCEDGGDTSSEASDRGDMQPRGVEMTQRDEDKWDCESILSTYSNVYNHPTKIVEPRPPNLLRREKIKLSTKSNLPLGVIPGPVPMEKHPEQASVTRSRHEDKEEKRARKKAIKEDRKQRRADKKATKLAFKSESLRLEKQLSGRLPTAPVV